MHERYWGLNGSPFQGTHDPHWFVETDTHGEALARLLFLVEQRRPFGLMRGPAGSGKSLVLNVAAREAKQLGRELAVVDLFGRDPQEMLWQLAVAWRLGPKERCSRWWLWQAVSDHLQALQTARLSAVLICDHLDRADADCLTLLEQLLHFPAASDGCLTILAAAREDFGEHIVTELLEHSDLRIDLPSLSRDETETLVTGLLHKAGCQRALFDDEALSTIHRLTHGEPRAILRLCDVTLAAGAFQEASHIDAHTVQAATGELPRSPRREFAFAST